MVLFFFDHTCYNRDIVSEHFNHFHCIGICDKLTRHLSMLTYIYFNVDERVIKGIVHLNIIFSYMKVNKICNLDHPVY